MRNYSVKSVTINPPWLIDAITNDAVGTPMRSRILGVADAYARVPLLFRAVRIRCNTLLNVPRHIYKLNKDGTKTEVPWMFPVDLDWLLWRSQASLLLAGGAALVKLRNEMRRSLGGPPQDLQWLNPFTVTIRWDAQLGKRVYTQTGQALIGGTTRTWTDDDMIFIREYAPQDDIGFGVAPAMVALQSSRVAFSIPQMAAQFFENGAMPVTTLSVAEGTDDDEIKRIEGFFQRAMRGVANAFRVIALRGDIKLQTTQGRMKDLEMPNLKDEARKDIARALEMPVTLLDSDETYATANSHLRSYYTDTVGPAAKMIGTGLNRDLLNPLGYEIEFALQELSIFQEDEKERALSFKTYVDAGMPPQVAAAMLGLSVPDVVQAQWDRMFDLSLMQRLTDAARANLITRDMWHVLQRLPKIDNVPVFVGATIRLTDTTGGDNNPISGEQIQDSSDQIGLPPITPAALPAGEKPTTAATSADADEEQLREMAQQKALITRQELEERAREEERRTGKTSAQLLAELAERQRDIERAQFQRVARKNVKRAAGFRFERLGVEEQLALYHAAKIVPAMGSDAHRTIVKKVDARRAPYEKRVADLVTSLFEQQRAALVDKLKAEAKAAPDLGDPTAWQKDFKGQFVKLLEALLPEMVVHALDDAGLAGSAFDVFDPAVADYIDQQAQRFATEINDTTWDQLKASLAEGTAAGESYSDLAARVEAVMGDRIASSAETIARTEVQAAYGFASQTAWEQSGEVESKSWVALQDNRTRPEHADAHGQTVPLDQPFSVGGEELLYPGDPAGSAENVINCRCLTIANLKARDAN